MSAIEPAPGIGFFERWLTAWVALCIVAGVALGHWFPAPVKAMGELQIAHVNLPVGALVWMMIVPMLMRIDFGALRQVTGHWRGIGVTLVVNWAIKPFSMALLAWIFVRGVFAPWLPPAEIDSYVAGLILLAAAPCTAMVFVWSQLTRGDPYFTLSQVALNDVIMVFAFAPIVGLLLGLSAIVVPWDTLLASVVLYIVVPLALAQLARRRGQPEVAAQHLEVCRGRFTALGAPAYLDRADRLARLLEGSLMGDEAAGERLPDIGPPSPEAEPSEAEAERNAPAPRWHLLDDA